MLFLYFAFDFSWTASRKWHCVWCVLHCRTTMVSTAVGDLTDLLLVGNWTSACSMYGDCATTANTFAHIWRVLSTHSWGPLDDVANKTIMSSLIVIKPQEFLWLSLTRCCKFYNTCRECGCKNWPCTVTSYIITNRHLWLQFISKPTVVAFKCRWKIWKAYSLH